MRNAIAYPVGLALGLANGVRHRVRGYRTPRPFDDADVARTAAHNREIVERWEERGGISFAGARVLELGPGSDLGTGELVVARGAASYVACDRFRLVDDPPLPYMITTFPGLPGVEGPFDLVVSNATLEHFEQVPETFLRLFELCAPGATMVHHVDAKTHMRWLRDRDPLNILRYRDTVYRLLDFPGAPNRLRASDYVRAAESAGFRARAVPGRLADPAYLEGLRLPRRYDPEDLRLLTFTLVATRA
jgi:hypothetical protein